MHFPKMSRMAPRIGRTCTHRCSMAYDMLWRQGFFRIWIPSIQELTVGAHRQLQGPPTHFVTTHMPSMLADCLPKTRLLLKMSLKGMASLH